MRISIIGLGKLGSSMLAYYASQGHQVTGIDIDEDTIELLNQGKPPVVEPCLREYLIKGMENYHCTNKYSYIKNGGDMTFIIVPTPTDETGEFSNEYVLEALKNVCEVIKYKEEFHVIVITSTVKLGSMRNEFKPLIENITGKKVGKTIGLAYNPEFIALGDVIAGLDHPDAILIGESDSITGDAIQLFYRATCSSQPPIHRMSWENAELAKIGLNVAVTVKIGIANTFSALCDKIEGGDVDKVTGFIGNDSRIGKKYFSGGMPPSGECFPRDARAFVKMAERLGVKADIMIAGDEYNNRTYYMSLLDKVTSLLSPYAKKISILGVSFKPDTPVITESAGLKLTEWLSNYEILVYDPQANYPDKAKTIRECLKDSNLAIITTPWDEFKDIKVEEFTAMQDKIVLDCWRILNKELLEIGGIEYHALGVND